MTDLVKEEERRKLIELALNAGRKRKSAQTGFVHLCYESQNEDHDTIPIFENFCFALALLRSRLTEDVKEAKTLIERLLAFEVEGNFPVYLHEYPQCRDQYLSIHLLPVFYFISEDFYSVLGEELSSSLQQTLDRVLIYAKNLQKEGVLSKDAEGKLLAFTKEDGFSDWTPRSINQWGHFLVSLQIASSAETKKHLLRAVEHWHTDLHCYVGPYGKCLHNRTEPASTLFDLFMGSLFGSYSDRVLEDCPLHLQAALIHPFPVLEKPIREKDYVFAFHEEGENALTLKWGNKEHLHSIAVPRLKSEVACKLNENSCLLTFQLPETLPAENEAEVALFCDNHEGNSIFINGKKASLFTLNDTVEILSQNKRILISFSQEGEGMFSGHILRANRPFQTGTKGDAIFEAYDWKIAVRTLRREAFCRLNMKIEMS